MHDVDMMMASMTALLLGWAAEQLLSQYWFEGVMGENNDASASPNVLNSYISGS